MRKGGCAIEPRQGPVPPAARQMCPPGTPGRSGQGVPAVPRPGSRRICHVGADDADRARLAPAVAPSAPGEQVRRIVVSHRPHSCPTSARPKFGSRSHLVPAPGRSAMHVPARARMTGSRWGSERRWASVWPKSGDLGLGEESHSARAVASSALSVTSGASSSRKKTTSFSRAAPHAVHSTSRPRLTALAATTTRRRAPRRR